MSIVFVTTESRNYQREKNYYLLQESYKLNGEFYEKISFTENILKFLAEKIVGSGNYSYSNIAFLINHQRKNFKIDLFAWTLIDFVNTDCYMVVDSIFGVRKQPIDMRPSARSWLKMAEKIPWKLQFSKPDGELITGQNVISTGFGITDEDGRFRGYLSAALNIDKLSKSLKSVIDNDVSFIVLDEELNFISSSNMSLNAYNVKIPKPLIYDLIEVKHNVPSLLPQPIKIGNHIFTLKINNESYPYVFLIGQNTVNYYSKFKHDIIPHIIRNITLGIIFVVILLFLSYLVVSPIIELSNITDEISQGKNVDIPKYEAIELNNLALQLSNIQNITKDLRYKQTQLTKVNKNLRSANEFIQSNMSFLSHELSNPTSSIIGFSKLLKEKLDKTEDNEIKEYIDVVHNIALYQDKQINFFLRLFEFQEKGKRLEAKEINLKKIIENNINMIIHHVAKMDIKIVVDIDPYLPNMIGDEMMIGQMIQNFATNGAKYNKKGGMLEVKAFTRVFNRKKEIVIQFKDNGIGIEEKDLEKLFKKFERIKHEKNNDIMGYGLGLAFARSCIVSHDGEIYVKSEPGIGTMFTITFPRARIANKSNVKSKEERKNVT
jgi:signal transduction histidine kinase